MTQHEWIDLGLLVLVGLLLLDKIVYLIRRKTLYCSIEKSKTRKYAAILRDKRGDLKFMSSIRGYFSRSLAERDAKGLNNCRIKIVNKRR